MMQIPMTLDKARQIAHAMAIGRKKFGVQFNPPYPHYDILEALSVFHEHASFGAPSAEEIEADNKAARDAVSAANRRAGMAEARLARCRKNQPPLQGGEQGGDLG